MDIENESKTQPGSALTASVLMHRHRGVQLNLAPDDAGPSALWRLPTAARPSIHEWEGDYVVYNPLSGDTHLLDVVAGEVLKLVVSGPLATVAVLAGIASFLEVPNDALLAKHVGQILARLDDLGLIEPGG